jgi:hypothetical protein
MHVIMSELHQVDEFRNVAAYGLLFLAHRMVKYGEVHFQSLLVDMTDTWADLLAVTSDMLFPLSFSEADIERIKLDGNGAVAGTVLVAAAMGRLGGLWLDKSFIEHERYIGCKAALSEVRNVILDQLAGTDEETDQKKYCWPLE